MKKLSLILAGGIVALMPLAMGGTASAAGTCQEGFTGPNSKNICTSVKKYECTVINNNTVKVADENVQIAVSGDATGSGSSTGSATNTNGTTFNATVTNGQTCVVVATTPAIPPKTTPPKTTVPAPEKTPAAVLPNTSGDEVMAYIAGLIALLGVGAVVARVAVSVYGHMKS